MKEYWEITKEEELEMAQVRQADEEVVDFFSEEAEKLFNEIILEFLFI